MPKRPIKQPAKVTAQADSSAQIKVPAGSVIQQSRSDRSRWARWWGKFDPILLAVLFLISLGCVLFASVYRLSESTVSLFAGFASGTLTGLTVLLRADGQRRGDDTTVITPNPAPAPPAGVGRCSICGQPCAACQARAAATPAVPGG